MLPRRDLVADDLQCAHDDLLQQPTLPLALLVRAAGWVQLHMAPADHCPRFMMRPGRCAGARPGQIVHFPSACPRPLPAAMQSNLFSRRPPRRKTRPWRRGAARAFRPGRGRRPAHRAGRSSPWPFRHLQTPGAVTMSAAMTNCGTRGWFPDRQYRWRSATAAARPGQPCPRCWQAWPAVQQRRFRRLCATPPHQPLRAGEPYRTRTGTRQTSANPSSGVPRPACGLPVRRRHLGESGRCGYPWRTVTSWYGGGLARLFSTALRP